MELIGFLAVAIIVCILVGFINRIIVDEFKDAGALLFALFMFSVLGIFFYETNINNCISPDEEVFIEESITQ